MPGGRVQVGHCGEVAVEVGSGALQLGEPLTLEMIGVHICDLCQSQLTRGHKTHHMDQSQRRVVWPADQYQLTWQQGMSELLPRSALSLYSTQLSSE